MTTKNIILYSCVGIASFLSIPMVQAQSDSLRASYFHIQLYKAFTPDLHSEIASTLPFAPTLSYADIALHYTGSYGNFHRAQESSGISQLGFDAEGAIPTKNNYMSGGFHFSQDYKQNIRFNTLLNPYRGTPYQLVDSTCSKWKIQNYSMWTSLATEFINNRLAGGLRLTLDVARGAKMVDPRPRTNNSRISATPSLSLQLGKQRLSGGVEYNRFREIANIILYNTNDPQKIYALKGLGQYTYDIFSSTERERHYHGNSIAGILSYQAQLGDFGFFLNGKYQNYGEEASDMENSKPRLRGRFYDDTYKGDIQLSYKNSRWIHDFKAEYQDVNQSGREIIQVFNSDPEVNAWQTDSEAPGRWKAHNKAYKGRYNFAYLDKTSYYALFGLSASVNYSNYSETYRVMDTWRKYKTTEYSIEPYFNRLLSKKQLVTIKLTAMIHRVSDFQTAYQGREADDHLVEELLIDYDNDLLRQNYYQTGIELSYGYLLKKSTLLLTLSYNQLQSQENQKRHYPTLSFSYHF